MTEQNGRTHNQVVELLSAYIDDEVTAGERALVETHLAACTACARDLATLRQTVTLLGQLPYVPAPRPFTLRVSDVKPVRPARPAWWRLPWARGLVAAAAMLLCVVVVVGVLTLGRTGMVGAPSAPEPVAMQAPPATEVAVEERVAVEKAVEVEVEKEMVVEEPAPAPAAEEDTAGFDVLQEAPAEAARAEGEAVADEAEVSLPTASPGPAVGAAPMPSATPTPAPTPEAMALAPSPALTPTLTPMPTPTLVPTPAPTLLEVEDLTLEIEPGLIRVSGRLPLPEGRKLLAELWRDGHPVGWATPESQLAVVEADGQFFLELQALSEVSNFDLFAAEPAHYELRIRPVDPPEPVEARIPFDTYGPPAAPPTSSP